MAGVLLRAVTLESANAAVRERLSAEKLVVVVVGTASEILDKLTNAIPALVDDHTVVPSTATEPILASPRR